MLPQAFLLIYGINSDECRIKTGEYDYDKRPRPTKTNLICL